MLATEGKDSVQIDNMQPAQSLPGRFSVLVVEDEMLITMLLEDMLEEAGCTMIGPCATMVEALAACDTERFDAALVDVSLADGRSDRVLEQLAARAIPFAIMSGQSDGLASEDAAASLAKPFTYEALVRALAQLRATRDG